MPKDFDKSKVEDLSGVSEKDKKDEEGSEIKENEKIEKVLAKYFLHGAAFSFLFKILAILWIFGLLVLTAFGSLIGLIIGVGILMLIIGVLNALLTSFCGFQ